MRRLLALTMCAVSLGLCAQISNDIPAEGLIAWLPLNGDANDVNGNYNGSPSSGIDFLEGECSNQLHASNDGSGSITLPSGIVDYPSQLTITGKFRLHSDYPQTLFRNGAGGEMHVVYDEFNDNQIRFSIKFNDGQWYRAGIELPALNEWYTFVATYNTFTDAISIYLSDVGFETVPSYNGTLHHYPSAPTQISKECDADVKGFAFWSRELSFTEISALLEHNTCGCADPFSCNYLPSSTSFEDCQYECCPGPGCCHDGTVWDSGLQKCVVANPADINFDGCVQLNDLLDLLGAYGNCAAEESVWQCGDPLEYQGYDYETVQIGEQCWFAENLRAENYSNGAPIQIDLSSNEWVGSTEGASAVYGESGSCEDSAPDFDACDSSIALATYGRLYNWYAVDDGRSVCPSEWHVPTDNEWMNLEIEIGMTEEEAMQTNCRGDVQGNFLKTTTGWNGGGNGTNAFGFSANPVGYRDQNGQFQDGGDEGHWWTSDSTNQSNAWYRGIGSWTGGVCRNPNPKNFGFAVRCIKDAE